MNRCESLEEAFGGIVAEWESRAEGGDTDHYIFCNHYGLSILRSIQMKLARLEESNANRKAAIEYLQNKRLIDYKKIGQENNYTPEEIEEYGRYIDVFAQDKCAISWREREVK